VVRLEVIICETVNNPPSAKAKDRRTSTKQTISDILKILNPNHLATLHTFAHPLC
jgi:hypothetical protein